MPFFSLGGANHERVVVTVLRHEHASVAARHAENTPGNTQEGWLAAEVAVWAGSFSAQFPVAFSIGDLDRWVAQDLDSVKLARKPFVHLPIPGVPGWCAANEDAGFYDDAAVFRPPRHAKPPCNNRSARGNTGATY